MSSETIKKVRCPKCGYTWKPRVPNPKACPECKVRLGWFGRGNKKCG